MDDFALCCGRAYGTILIDIAASPVVDVLPERSADALAAWLRDPPCDGDLLPGQGRGCVEEAARAAPPATQIADW
ncbi:hypothetical protein GCM10010116_40720 [Microbispora rosea subsp. aerata]|nr:hypothetical protein [Microbispora rosea]GGO20311.1 hypothetical protein GCM10010116_40720 [Microbispora rosea subsp. aerata]GIH57191.1 hypothetical protein Mro02_41050 [Microbispora rosea subsp. aerata]GLJ84739.1 hypothetical protein GCM10017588_34670 [Microbispora rosea subsp. aerata]